MEELLKKNESETNEIVSKTVLSLLLFILVFGVFCWTGIFSISNKIINTFILASISPLILPTVLVKLFHINKSWVKYVIITSVIVVSGISYIMFTFQVILVFMIPSIISLFYLEKRVIMFTGLMSIFNIILVHFITGVYLFQPWIEPFVEMKFILLYGALPRVMQYVFCMFLLYILSKRFSNIMSGFSHVLENEKLNGNVSNTIAYSDELNYALNQLTEREKDVFELVVKGYTNAQIAHELYLSNGTVKNYVSMIYNKLEWKDRTALIIKFSSYYHSHDRGASIIR